MAMRGEGQIAELVAIAEPDVGVIVNVGPGAPRAARHGRAGGRGEGRADPRPASRRGLRGARHRAAAGRPPARRPRHLDLRARRRGAAPRRSTTAVPRSRRAGGGSSSSCRYSEPHNLLNTLAAVAAATCARGRAGGSRGRALLLAARRGRGAPRRRRGRERLLQRQPDVDARRPRPPRGEPGRAPDRGARRDGRAGPGRPSVPPRDRRARRARAGSTCWYRWARRRSPYAEGYDGEAHAVATPEEAGALLEELARPGDRVLVKGSRSAGLERVLGRGLMLGEIMIGGIGLAAHLHVPRARSSSSTCARRSSASRSARRGRPATTARPARRRWAGSRSFVAVACRS